MPEAHPPAGSPSVALQMSFLMDTDLLSLLERKRVPSRLAIWVQENEAEIFLSVVSFAEL
jgi:predicted nucleic acid-binding protein